MIRRSLALLGLVAAVVLAGCASDDWETRYNELHGETLDVVQQRDEARQQIVDLAAQQEATKSQLAQRERELAEAREAARTAADRANEYANALNSQPTASEPTVDTRREAAARVVEDLKGKGIAAFATDDGNVEMRLSSDVTFASGEAELTKEGKSLLRQLAPQINGRFAPFSVRIVGHTDNEPLKRTKAKWGDNWRLGQERALAVVRFLETEMSVAPGRLEAVSRGEQEPLVPNTTKENRAKNRRVAIVVVMPADAAEAMAR